MDIKSTKDLFSFWKGSIKTTNGESKGPCPFCAAANNEPSGFEGRDRFIFYRDGHGCFCRICHQEGRGASGTGYYSLAQVAQHFGVEISGDYKHEEPEIQERPLTKLWVEPQVAKAHIKVDRQYWYDRGLSDETINRFRLGLDEFYGFKNQHIIPMQGLTRYGRDPRELFYIASRGTAPDGTPLKLHSKGTSKPYLWIQVTDPTDKRIAICEGDIDPLVAYELGWKNFATTFGATTWIDEKADILIDLGFEEFDNLVDGGDAGEALGNKINQSLLKRQAKVVRRLQWNTVDKDIGDVLQESKDRDEARLWIAARLRVVRRDTGRSSFVNLTEERPDVKIVPLDVIRGTGPESMEFAIRTFLNAYNLLNRGKGELLHLQSPPGAGKTHILVKIAEEIAERAILDYQKQFQAYEDALDSIREDLKNNQYDPEEEQLRIDKIEQLEKSRDNLSCNSVAWYGQYVNGWGDLMNLTSKPHLWYNMEARNNTNCGNFPQVMKLGAMNHDVGRFCHTVCDKAHDCKKTGYLSQNIERKKYPIAFLRHQHLYAPLDEEYRDLAIIDEYPGSVLENNIIEFEIRDIYAHVEGWQLEVALPDETEAIVQFAKVVRAAMSENSGAPQRLPDGSLNPEYTVSGAAFMQKMEVHSQSLVGIPLNELVGKIDSRTLHEVYQPQYSGGTQNPLKRCLPQFYDVLFRELPEFLTAPGNQFPSCLHCVSGKMEVYASQRVHNRHRTPMIAADATGIKSLYQAMFKRTVRSYSPQIRNLNTTTEVIHGTDWTKSQMNKELGKVIQERKALQDIQVPTLGGGTFNTSNVPVSEDVYDSSMLRDALSITKHLAQKHESLLVVTHKDIREILESIIQSAWKDGDLDHLTDRKRLALGHYGALRGTNEYEHYQAVCLIGVFRIPYNVLWRRIQMWAWLLGIKEYIPPDTSLHKSSYEHESGVGHEHRTFNHAFAQSIVDMIERGEIQQSLSRIRPHSNNEKKFVYFFGSRPAVQFVDTLTTKSSWMNTNAPNEKYAELQAEMEREYVKTKKFPTYAQLRKKYGVGNSIIRTQRKTIEAKYQKEKSEIHSVSDKTDSDGTKTA